MVYILNTNLKNEKKVEIALFNMYGVGKKLAKQICGQLGISSDICINQLSNLQIEQLTQLILQYYRIGSELRQSNQINLQRLVRVSCYRGFRHRERLPVRGQRTHGNARTVRKLIKKTQNFSSVISKQKNKKQ